MTSSDSDTDFFYDAEDMSPCSAGSVRRQHEEPSEVGVEVGSGKNVPEVTSARAKDMELRRYKLQAMRNQLSDDSPRGNSKGLHDLGKCHRESQSDTVECNNDCDKSDAANISTKSPPEIAMETRNIAMESQNIAMETRNIDDDDEWEEAESVTDDDFQVALESTRSLEHDNLDTPDGRAKEACCKLVSGVDITTLSRICELNANRGNISTSAAVLHSKQPDIVESVLPSCRVEPASPVAPPRRRKKHAPLPPLTRIDVDKEAPMSLTPPSVDAVKGMMPLQSISSDGSDLVSSPDFSLTEMDLSKVSIADDLEQSLDISSATQGNRMVTAVEDSSSRADLQSDPAECDLEPRSDGDPLATPTSESHNSGDDVIGVGTTDENHVPLLMQRPRTNSGSRFLSDKEILDQVKVVNLDTGEELTLSLAEEKLPQCVNPLSLHIMRRTKEYSKILEFLHIMQTDSRRRCECRRRGHASRSVDRSTTATVGTDFRPRADSDSSLHKHRLASDGEEQPDRRSEFGTRTLNTVVMAKRRGVKLKRMFGKTVNKIKHKADEVFHGDDNSASDEDEVADGRRMIKIKAASVHKGPYDFDLLVPVQDLSGEHMGAVWTMKFSPCGRLLATGGQDKLLRVWVLKEACSYFIDMRHKYMYTEGGVSRVSPAPSQDSVNSDAASDTSTSEAHKNEGDDEDDAHAPFMKKPFCIYKGHTGDLLDISWSKNYFVLSSSMDKTVRLWHVSRRECLCCFQHIDFVTAIAFHPKDDRYFLSGSLDGKLRLWSIPDKKVALWNEVGGQSKLITAVNFCMDGKFAVVGTYDGLCIFYSTEQLKYFTQIHVRSTRGKNARGRKITGLEPYPGEGKLLVTSNDSRMRIYDLRDLTLTCKYKGSANNSSQIKASFSHDGKYITCGSEDQAVYIWRTQHDVAGGRRDRNSYWESIKAHSAVVTVAIFSPSPHLIIRPQFASVESNPTEETDTSSIDSLGEALVSADFSGAIKVFINKFKPSPE